MSKTLPTKKKCHWLMYTVMVLLVSVTLFLVCIPDSCGTCFYQALACIPTSCRTSGQYVEELKRCIPDVKELISENEEVFLEIMSFAEQKSNTALFYLGLDSTRDDTIVVTIEGYLGSNKTSEDLLCSEFFTPYEKESIQSMFSLSVNEVSVNSYVPVTLFYLKPTYSLVNMAVFYSEKDSIVKKKTASADYWEEILENWYVLIMVAELG